ncbi:MAG TPA: alanine racemase [Pyrinomonadaceae bacterium]|jgi:alanine racemase
MAQFDFARPTWAEVNLENLAFNFRSVKDFIGSQVKFMAVVKADAYGHGAVQCARRLEALGVDWLAVALPEEGIELREAGLQKPILCLGGFWFGQENLLLDNDLTPVIYRIDKAISLDRTARERGRIVNVHLKIDTGMGRLGVRFDEVSEFSEKLRALANLNVEGVMTHFASADKLSENDFTNMQIKRFNDCVDILASKGFNPIFKDLANSPGAIVHAQSRADMVRIGGILYGLGGDVLPSEVPQPELRPVMSVFSQISHLKKVPKGETLGYSRSFQTSKDSLIATVPIGYEDGLPRILSNTGKALVNGHFAPIVGRISMDWIILDVTDVPHVKLEDEVVIIGKQNDLKITAEEIAELCSTISYEITCGFSKRIPKKYVGSQKKRAI